MPPTPEQEEVRQLLRSLSTAEGDDAEAQLTRLIALRRTGPLGTFSRVHDLVQTRRAAWRGPIEGAFAASGLPLDTAGLLELRRDAVGPMGLLIIELLARRPDAAEAAQALIDDTSGGWMDQQSRFSAVAQLAEAMGPQLGAPVLHALWRVTDDAYRDVHYRIGRALHHWGEDAAPFLLARLDDDPLRALGEVSTLALRWGGRLDEVVARVEALAEVPELAEVVDNVLHHLRPRTPRPST